MHRDPLVEMYVAFVALLAMGGGVFVWSAGRGVAPFRDRYRRHFPS